VTDREIKMSDSQERPFYSPKILDEMVESGDANGLADAVRHLQSELTQCMMLAGADITGHEYWYEIRYAVDAVEDMAISHDEYAELLDEIAGTMRRLK